jgi:hypothetical protein
VCSKQEEEGRGGKEKEGREFLLPNLSCETKYMHKLNSKKVFQYKKP